MSSDRCMCGAVQGFWDATDEYPFTRQGTMHSPLGCLRGEVHDFQLRELYHRCTGLDYYGQEPRVLFQVVMSALARNPQVAESVEGLVLETLPCHPPGIYTPEVVKPRRHVGSQGGGTGGRVYRDPTPAPWLPSSGSPKPPWEKSCDSSTTSPSPSATVVLNSESGTPAVGPSSTSSTGNIPAKPTSVSSKIKPPWEK